MVKSKKIIGVPFKIARSVQEILILVKKEEKIIAIATVEEIEFSSSPYS
ncbi:MAG: hypothetical protein QNJ49_18465 [Mastigocoleus sp. MO_167.B18]|nr:hypothetical protein [Mastigocoleus sp. MO_167.B18]